MWSAHERVEILRRGVRVFSSASSSVFPSHDVHHEVERLPELLGDPRLVDDARIALRAQVLDVVAEADARGHDRRRRR